MKAKEMEEKNNCNCEKDNNLDIKLCCHNNAENTEKDCCSHVESVKPKEGSCCSHIENLEAKENSCCSYEHTDVKESSCCSHKHTDVKESSCCGIATSPSVDSIDHLSCCGIATNVNVDSINHLSCCGIAMNSRSDVDHLSCCGIATNDSGSSCCGISHTKKKVNAWVLIAISGVALIISFLLSHFNVYETAPKGVKILDFAWISIIISGYAIFKGAFISLFKNKKITSALLISIAMSASILMGILNAFEIGKGMSHGSYFFAAGEIAFLMALGQTIENITVGKARSGITELMKISPTKAFKKVNDEFVETHVSLLEVGDIVLVKPNELVPIDGVLIDGTSAIDQSTITGEYTPVDVSKGSLVYAGTKNQHGAFEMEVSSKSSETIFSQLVAYVKEAELKKAPIVMLADKSATVLVLSSIFISVLVFLISFFGLKVGGWSAIQRAATILVVVCPCAFGLATPIAISAAIGNSSRKGILVKNGAALETLGKVKTIAFDKTGTLTKGDLVVDEIITKNLDEYEFLKLVASAEAKSEHPIARAILNKYDGKLYPVSEFESLIGSGFRAKVDGKILEISKLSDRENLIEKELYDRILSSGKTSIAVVVDGNFEGIITLTDTIKEEVKGTLESLHEMGISTVMLTGDNKLVAQNVANEIGVSSYKANLLPQDKVIEVESMAKNGVIAMVGDGINDGPSIAASDCSIAMGGIGNSVVMQTADITLMQDDISKVSFLVKLSKRTISTIKINIGVSLTISFLAVILSIFGILNVVSGALLHNLSSVLVCLNSAFLLGYKGTKNDQVKSKARA